MNKKAYQAPSIEVVKIQHTEMLMGSNGNKVRTLQTNLESGDGLNYVGSDADYNGDVH